MSELQKVKLAVTDIDGVLRGKYIHKNKFLSVIKNGMGFCNVVFGWDCADVCYENSQYTGWHTGYPDAQVKLDIHSYREIPWENNLPFFLGEFETDDGYPLSICPRQLLKKIINLALKLGFKAKFGLEFEWFNFKESPESLHEKEFTKLTPLTPGMFGYSILRAGYNREFFTALMDELNAFDVPLEGLHTETGPGVYEAAIAVADPLTAADRGILFKTSTKEIAYRFGIVPSFMAKWNASLPGCSGHIHQSLWDKKEEKNLFHDSKDEHSMSPLFKNYLAGQMFCLPEILPMFAPTVNSYKRLVEGLWAPTRITWACENRTAAFRVIPGSSKSTRLETRVAGADINPYLAIAAALASGLYGIQNKLELTTPPVQGNAYKHPHATKLPQNLFAATMAMDKSQVARELFGDEFVDHFVASRLWEWEKFQEAVTDWELKRYFEII
ncbi:MAG: glutamine synthetase [Bdellovibrio sp.]|nr:MAG: glutamine synthetase [Bdellovibrio sp.]